MLKVGDNQDCLVSCQGLLHQASTASQPHLTPPHTAPGLRPHRPALSAFTIEPFLPPSVLLSLLLPEGSFPRPFARSVSCSGHNLSVPSSEVPSHLILSSSVQALSTACNYHFIYSFIYINALHLPSTRKQAP